MSDAAPLRPGFNYVRRGLRQLKVSQLMVTSSCGLSWCSPWEGGREGQDGGLGEESRGQAVVSLAEQRWSGLCRP